jgi:hypothetical protein
MYFLLKGLLKAMLTDPNVKTVTVIVNGSLFSVSGGPTGLIGLEHAELNTRKIHHIGVSHNVVTVTASGTKTKLFFGSFPFPPDFDKGVEHIKLPKKL